MRIGTRGSSSWPGFIPEPDTLAQTGHVSSNMLLADRAGHTFHRSTMLTNMTVGHGKLVLSHWHQSGNEFKLPIFGLAYKPI